MTSRQVLIEMVDGTGTLTLNRPEAINALTMEMMVGLDQALRAWMDDPEIERVLLKGSGERGFCAGADVKALRAHLLAGGSSRPFFAFEYELDAMIADYPKPVTALMHGITMGGGLGLTAHANERVVFEDSRLAMPETIIGLFPDVGVLYELSRAPGELGTHLALTGTTIGAADALLVGLADRCQGEPPPGVLDEAREWIDPCYRGSDPVAIIAALEASDHPEARATAAELRRRSPVAVCVTLAALRRAATLPSVRAVLAQDLVLAPRMAEDAEFAEGVRAQVVDKDRQPRWRFARIEDVPPDLVAELTARW